ncbi:hypothetical protein [Spirosoma koreense]
MKAQLFFLSIFMKVVLLLLVLAFCFTAGPQPRQESACRQTQHSLQPVSLKSTIGTFLNPVTTPCFE